MNRIAVVSHCDRLVRDLGGDGENCPAEDRLALGGGDFKLHFFGKKLILIADRIFNLQSRAAHTRIVLCTLPHLMQKPTHLRRYKKPYGFLTASSMIAAVRGGFLEIVNIVLKTTKDDFAVINRNK